MKNSAYSASLRSIQLFMKNLIPPNIRIQLRVFFTILKDFSSRRFFLFVKKSDPTIELPSQLALSQPIRKNDYSENKKHNLQLAIRFLQNKIIEPNQILSFWHLIPAPTPKNGFKKGRNLLNNQLDVDYGGGLCQLSGILYHLALQAGLKIVERHPHSLDIYTEESRYTSLGSDATVVYGYKDLRIKNPFSFPIAFRFEIKEAEIVAHICAAEKIEKHSLDFEVEIFAQQKKVKVWSGREANRKLISQDFYKNLNS